MNILRAIGSINDLQGVNIWLRMVEAEDKAEKWEAEAQKWTAKWDALHAWLDHLVSTYEQQCEFALGNGDLSLAARRDKDAKLASMIAETMKKMEAQP